MLKLVVLAAVAVLVAACGAADAGREVEAELQRLDEAVRGREVFLREKDRRIARLREHLYTDSVHRYEICDSIYSEYFSYNLDSASHYAALKARIALDAADSVRYAVALLHFGRMNMALGNDADALSALRAAAPDTAVPSVAIAYCDAMATYDEIKGRRTGPWRDRLAVLLAGDTASTMRVFNEVNRLSGRGDYAGALGLLRPDSLRLSRTVHDRALCNYLEARVHLLAGDTAAALRPLVVSAYNDIVTPVRDYKSLYELAALLLKRGDIDRAYRYINVAVEDGNAARVVDNTRAVNAIMPDIIKAREAQTRSRRVLYVALGCAIALLSVVLGVLLVWVWRKRNTLSDINGRLESLNKSLSESNRVKDAYLVQYFDLCSEFVEALDRFRSNVSSTLRLKGVAGIEKLLAANGDDRELRRFYANFDDTFLSLFPGFVDKFNGLLQPDSRVHLGRDGSMTNELRTFALIRLGITDSEQIARLLRRSISTVYNYRVKMRNAALCPRGEFEDRVKSIL